MKNSLYKYAEQEDIHILEKKLPIPKLKGLYTDGIVILSSDISTETEKNCILAEELGHYATNHGQIIDDSLNSIKQERLARLWAYKRLVPLDKIIEAYRYGCSNKFELAEYLDVTEDFLSDAIKAYKIKYGIFLELDDYIVYFEPFGILKKFKGDL